MKVPLKYEYKLSQYHILELLIRRIFLDAKNFSVKSIYDTLESINCSYSNFAEIIKF